jgi:hypothetical protein
MTSEAFLRTDSHGNTVTIRRETDLSMTMIDHRHLT